MMIICFDRTARRTVCRILFVIPIEIFITCNLGFCTFILLRTIRRKFFVDTKHRLDRHLCCLQISHDGCAHRLCFPYRCSKRLVADIDLWNIRSKCRICKVIIYSLRLRFRNRFWLFLLLSYMLFLLLLWRFNRRLCFYRFLRHCISFRLLLRRNFCINRFLIFYGICGCRNHIFCGV